MSDRKQQSLLKKRMKADLEKDRVRKQLSRQKKRELGGGMEVDHLQENIRGKKDQLGNVQGEKDQVGNLQENMQGKKKQVANKKVTKQNVNMKQGKK